MARRTADILQRAVSAFINQDLQSAQFIVTQAALVDAAYYRVYCEGLDYVEAEPAIVEHVRLQFTVAYDLQCVAHHIAHLCERTSYIVMGEWPRLTKFTADDLLVAVE